MSRFLARAATAAACIAIVLLVVLLVILWTGVRSGSISGSLRSPDLKNETVTSRVHGLTEEPDRSQAVETVGEGSIFNRPTHRFDLKTRYPGEAENATNEVRSRSSKVIEGQDVPRQEFDEHVPPAGDNVAHVSLKKMHQNIYEDPVADSTAARHHTGHFRHTTAEIWDPHPQYEFKAFGKDFHLLLSHDTSFVSPNIKVTHVGENSTKREHPGHQLGCFYSGTVKGDPKSVVSVSLCHGMNGYIRTSSGNYFIQPADRQKMGQSPVDKPLLHVIHLASATRSNSNSVDLPDERTGDNDCVLVDTVEDESSAPLIDDTSGSKSHVGEHPRERRSITKKTSIDESVEDYSEVDESRRENVRQFVRHNDRRQFLRRHERPNTRYYPAQHRNYPIQKYQEPEFEDPFETWRPRRALPQEYFIEVMIVADSKMAEYHGEGLFNYILVLMSTVARIYKDPSIGNAISIAVVKITKTSETFGRKYPDSAGIAANEMLKRFCLWQKHNNHPDQDSPEHHDAALLLTRENLCHKTEEERCDTLGLAELGQMCVPKASCAIVQDNGLAAAFTIAHEIGHVFSMPHDDDPTCRQFSGNTRIHNVMSRMLDDKTFPWKWSNCSRHYVTQFLDSGYGNCLLDEPNQMIAHPGPGRLPGEDYSENKQCELVFGQGSKICPYMAVCRRLWCTAPVWDQEQQCHTQHMPWADGTACDYGKWCQRGECVSRKNLKPVDGQWSPWGEYGNCSRTCGGGIRKKYRECNSPQPQNGGNYCTGPRVKYRSCETKDCPSDGQDFREEQCSRYNDKTINIGGIERKVRWHAKYTRIQPQDRCKLYCQVEGNQYFKVSDKVIDGTPCSLDTFDICVDGICKPAGCDHVLNSTAELDTCGVCRGDNSSCQRITGLYNVSKYGYNRVTKIPAGSSYIDIRQHGWKESNNDSNYLALRHGERGDYILNGKNMISHHKMIIEPGLTMEYSGPESVIERLNSSRPIAVDLILEILSVENLFPPQISYEYTVPKNILTSYRWVLSNWSGCNRVCHGSRHRVAECRSTVHKDVVSDDYCRAEEKPSGESQSCNTHCNVRWDIISKSECSSHCGPGTRTVISQCTYHHSSISRRIAEHACKHLDRPDETVACRGPCDDTHWLYGAWGPCSASCKGGIQVRTATCVDSDGNPVSETKCIPEDKVLKRDCGQKACPEWALGYWTPCSVTCGTGVRQQAYWCQIENRVVSSGYCNNPPPETLEPCEMVPCPSWQHGDWSSCSVSCGEGIAQREVVCKGPDGAPSSNCSTKMPPNTKICKSQPCPVQTIPSTAITYAANPNDYLRPHENEIDNDKNFSPTIMFLPGYKWRTGNFGECSKPCGIGYKERAVKCSSAETGQIIRDDYCDRNQKPLATMACNQHACPRWNTGDWSQCDSECGAAFKHRQVRCQTERGEILPDNECPGSEKPKHVERCMKVACGERRTHSRKANSPVGQRPYRWRMSKWTPVKVPVTGQLKNGTRSCTSLYFYRGCSATGTIPNERCSKSCGNGTKTRRVDCIANSIAGDVTPVDERECSKLERRPKSQRPCQRIPCDLTWQEGAWSECSEKCGDGTQRRTVSCHRVDRFGWSIPAHANGCRMNEKPPTEQVCKLRECGDEYYWVPGPWKKCTAPCGRKGKQLRRLFCHRKDGKKVPKVYCPIKFRPQRRRKCNQHRCPPVTCLDVKKRFKTTVDREYSLLVKGKTMSIYCHNMSGDHPLEYLTLPGGERENFAEIYNKRLLDLNTCPFNGQRDDACKCDNYRTTSGHTMFRKIRLDPKTLNVVVDDYTFSTTQGENRVEFGKAGDCYSSASCPQGRFSINLTGTQLRLSPDLSWVSQGKMTSRSINKISQQRVVGKCGGYCGFCKLETGLKLDVLPP